MKKMVEEFLRESFAGESMARMKYLNFSIAAEKEDKPNVARLFRAIARAEEVHAGCHARLLGYVGSTEENLQAGIDGETFEVDEMYAAYLRVAEEAGETGAVRSMTYAREAEKGHAELYEEALGNVKAGKDADLDTLWVCPSCGYTMTGEAPDNCPVCGCIKQRFEEF
jgi:rubrerythrin